MQTQDLIKRGMKLIVGDGEHINVRKDNWLHSQPPSPAQGRGTETHPHIRVKDLFHPGTKEWNVQLISDLVRQEDAKYILNIRPPISRRPDVLVRNYTRTWEYSVKTGYYIQRNFLTMEAGNQETSAVISEEVRKCCSSIWSLNIPPKIKTFWWRIAHGGIALLDNLRRRGVKMDNTCLVCGNAKPYVFSMQSGQGGLGAQHHFFYGLGPE